MLSKPVPTPTPLIYSEKIEQWHNYDYVHTRLPAERHTYHINGLEIRVSTDSPPAFHKDIQRGRCVKFLSQNDPFLHCQYWARVAMCLEHDWDSFHIIQGASPVEYELLNTTYFAERGVPHTSILLSPHGNRVDIDIVRSSASSIFLSVILHKEEEDDDDVQFVGSCETVAADTKRKIPELYKHIVMTFEAFQKQVTTLLPKFQSIN